MKKVTDTALGAVMIVSLILALLGMVSCGKFTKKETTAVFPELEDKVRLYESRLPEFQDDNGFIFTSKCDSLFLSGLLSAAYPGDIDIEVASDGAQWYRRPDHKCGPEFGNSRSTISRDQILGALYHMWYNQRVDVAVQLMDSLRANNYMLKGEGTPGELLMTPALLSTLAHLILKLGGPRYSIELALPTTLSSEVGYIAHLAAWHINLRGEILGEISEDHFDLLRKHTLRVPKNPLFQAVYHKFLDGDQTLARDLFMDNAEWPADRLPSSDEHCDEWPISRDYTDNNWGPCSPRVVFPGAELLVVYHLVIK